MFWIIIFAVFTFSGCDRPNKDRFIIYASPNLSSPILLDKFTGESWRYFKDVDAGGGMIAEGWTNLSFGSGTERGQTPEIADRKLKQMLDKESK